VKELVIEEARAASRRSGGAKSAENSPQKEKPWRELRGARDPLNNSLVVCVALIAGACASGPRPAPIPLAEALRCAGLSDSVSKYVSEDALPFAHLVGTPRTLPVPATMPADSVAVEFVVRPDGVADTSSVQITGASDPQFVRSVMLFATQSRFTPAQVSGCNVLSRYNLIVKPRRSTS
jgi:hypothetical protein